MNTEQTFQDNQGLVYYIYNRSVLLNNQATQRWKEDIIQEGMFALWRACCSYEESKNIAFSTYAYKCIYNAMSCYVQRKIYKHSSNIALEEDIIASDQYDSWEYSQIVQDYLKCCSEQTRFIINKTLDGYTQIEIATMLDISQPSVQKCTKKFKQNLKKFLEGKL